MAYLEPKDLQPLADHLNERYGGQTDALRKHLETALFMLFFLEEETFSGKEVQHVADVLHNLKDALRPI